MFAPSGVDSDSSGETLTPPSSPITPRPQFSFKSLLPSRRKTIKTTDGDKLTKSEAVEKLKLQTPVEAAETFGEPIGKATEGVLKKKKKKVRIRVEGEDEGEEGDTEMGGRSGLDTGDIPGSDKALGRKVSPESTISLVSPGAQGEDTTGRRPEDVAGEVLGVLRQLMAESAASRSQLRADNDEDPEIAPISPYRSPVSKVSKLFKLSAPPPRTSTGKTGKTGNNDTRSNESQDGMGGPRVESEQGDWDKRKQHGTAADYYNSFENSRPKKLVVQNPTDEGVNGNVTAGRIGLGESRSPHPQSMSPAGKATSASNDRSPRPHRQNHHPPAVLPTHDDHPWTCEHTPGYLCSPSRPDIKQPHPGYGPYNATWSSAGYSDHVPLYNSATPTYYQNDPIHPNISPQYRPGQFNPAMWYRYQQNQQLIPDLTRSPSETTQQGYGRSAKQQQTQLHRPTANNHHDLYGATYTPSQPYYGNPPQRAREGTPPGYPDSPSQLTPSMPPHNQDHSTHYDDHLKGGYVNPERGSNGLQIEVSPERSAKPAKHASPSRIVNEFEGVDQHATITSPIKSPNILVKGPEGWREVESKVAKDGVGLLSAEILGEEVGERILRVTQPDRAKDKVSEHEEGKPREVNDDRERRAVLNGVREEKERMRRPRARSAVGDPPTSTRNVTPTAKDSLTKPDEEPEEVLSRDEEYAAAYKLKKMEYLRREREKEKEKAKKKDKQKEEYRFRAKTRTIDDVGGKGDKIAPFVLADPVGGHPIRSEDKAKTDRGIKDGTPIKNTPVQIEPNRSNETIETDSRASRGTQSGGGALPREEKYAEEYKRRKMEYLQREKEKTKAKSIAKDAVRPDDLERAVRKGTTSREVQPLGEDELAGNPKVRRGENGSGKETSEERILRKEAEVQRAKERIIKDRDQGHSKARVNGKENGRSGEALPGGITKKTGDPIRMSEDVEREVDTHGEGTSAPRVMPKVRKTERGVHAAATLAGLGAIAAVDELAKQHRRTRDPRSNGGKNRSGDTLDDTGQKEGPLQRAERKLKEIASEEIQRNTGLKARRRHQLQGMS
jgi:hypothetical protein